MKKSLIFLSICLAGLYFSGCSLISPKDYESIKGKEYHLSKIHFFRKGSTQGFVFKLMNDMQVPKIMALLEHKYGISVDHYEFDLFLYNKDPLKIRAEGLITDNDFYWESGNEYPNKIEIDVSVTETPSALVFNKDYAISIKIEKSTKVRVQGGFVGEFPAIAEIASRLNYRKKPEADDIYINKDTKEEIDLFLEFTQKGFSPEAEAERNYLLKRSEIRNKIKDSYDGLSPAERERYIKDIRECLDELTK